MWPDRRAVSLDRRSVRLPASHLTQSARSLRTPGEATRPARHQCLGVHNNATQPLSQPFVSATLALRELLSVSWRESGIPAPHPSQVLSPADGPLPRLFPRLPVHLSAAFIGWMLPPCTTVVSQCLLQLPSAQAYITPDTGGQFFPLFVLAHQELTVMAGGQ